MTSEIIRKEVEAFKGNATAAVNYFASKLAFEIAPTELGRAVNNKEPLQIVDLRGPNFYEQGHVPGAVNVSLDKLDEYAGKLKKDVRTVVYCSSFSCFLSARGALVLAEKGYYVQLLTGGWSEYSIKKQPVAEVQTAALT